MLSASTYGPGIIGGAMLGGSRRQQRACERRQDCAVRTVQFTKADGSRVRFRARMPKKRNWRSARDLRSHMEAQGMHERLISRAVDKWRAKHGK